MFTAVGSRKAAHQHQHDDLFTAELRQADCPALRIDQLKIWGDYILFYFL